MGKINIEGVILTPLMKIQHPKGNILHGMKRYDDGFVGFGEVYLSIIKGGEIKGWNRHQRMTLNLVVPVGKVNFVISDDRETSKSKGNCFEIEISPDNYQRLTVPPGLWLAFQGKEKGTNLVLNISDIEHDPDELERLELDQIDYNWDYE